MNVVNNFEALYAKVINNNFYSCFALPIIEINQFVDDMRKVWNRMTAVLIMSFCLVFPVLAQMGPLPVDPKVRTGQLDNGLTYYIRHNELPKERAEFYIAQRVGSMQEEEDQRGLAHFLEHMAFNGTTHFPGKSMLTYLESIGAKFGTNINAYTSFDETVYTLMNIPVTREGIVDSCLLILYDWSCGIALEDEEIDSERGVIHEEWRTGQSAQMRIWEQILPVVFEGSRYGHRLPIGTMEVVDNFPYQVLRDYYHRWYRPDNQAIVIVGDIDVDQVEQKIIALFSPIEMPENPEPRIYFDVPDNVEPIVAVGKDKELTNARMTVYYKHDPVPAEMRNTPVYYIFSYLNSVVSQMINARMDELTNQPEPPFLAAGAYDDMILGVTQTKEAFTTVAISHERDIQKALEALVRETRRIDQHGFTASEYARARADFLNSVETMYNEREKQTNDTYVDEYVRSFLQVEPIPGVETEYALFNQLAPPIPLEQVNQYIKELITDENVVIVLQGPDKEGVALPGSGELLAIFNQVRAEDTEPYEDTVSDEPLISQLPAPGLIVSTMHDDVFDATVWMLSNGAKVIIKKTPWKDDQILMQASSNGGTSLIDSRYDRDIEFLNDAGSIGGLGSFSATDLPKVLAGKQASVSASVGELSETVSANCAPRDLETMMQLVYLQFTAVRPDNDAYASWKSRTSATLQNMTANPMYVYQDSLSTTLYSRHPRMALPTPEDVERFNYEEALGLFRQRFANASDFTFLFVGNIDPETLKPFAEQYLATLPTAGDSETAGAPILYRGGDVINFFDRKVESPKVSVAFIQTGRTEGSLENMVRNDMLSQILRSRYTETMREEEGGTYGASVQTLFSPLKEQYGIFIQFDTNIEQYPRLKEIAIREMETIAEHGPADVDFRKVQEFMLKKFGEDTQDNSYWMRRMNSWFMDNMDYYSRYAEAVSNLTPEAIRHFAKELLDQGNRMEVTMNGVTE